MKKLYLTLFLFGGLTFAGYAQSSSTYQLPPKSIADLVDAPSSPTVRFNKNGSLMLLLQAPGFASIEQVAQPVIGIAGIKVNPANNCTEGENSALYNSLTLKDVKTGKELKLTGLPEDPRLTNITWSPEGDDFAVHQ